MLAPLNVKSVLFRLRDSLIADLGSQGSNLLGEYEFLQNGVVVGTTPSIEIRYAGLRTESPKRMKTESGIECILDPQPDEYMSLTKRGKMIKKYFEIILIQHNPIGFLSEAISTLMANPRYLFLESPVIRKGAKLRQTEGYDPPRAILYSCQTIYLPDAK